MLEKAVERYEKLKSRDPWSQINLGDKKVLKVNEQSAAVRAIKDRLELLGDLRKSHSFFGGKRSDPELYTQNVETAVKRFQRRHGLNDDGIVGPAVLKALNMSPDARIRQLRVNMSRLMADTLEFSGTRIIANIPEFKLYVLEDNREILAMDIVVGKTTNPTVVFNDEIEHVVFSPYWNVPASIVKNEILPEMEKNSGYLQNENMEITGTRDGLPVIRQRPGPENALGKVKFMFPNKYNIYFHDTPAKSLFDRSRRAFSHGCIRLSKPFDLARLLLRHQDEWTDEAIRRAMNTGEEKWVALETHVPVAISYYTAWVDSDGTVNFRDDIYGRDNDVLSLESSE